MHPTALGGKRNYAELRSQLATSSSSTPLTTKLAANTQAKLATSSGVGPNTLTTKVEIERPAISKTASKKSMPAETAVHIRTDPPDWRLATSRITLRISSQAIT